MIANTLGNSRMMMRVFAVVGLFLITVLVFRASSSSTFQEQVSNLKTPSFGKSNNQQTKVGQTNPSAEYTYDGIDFVSKAHDPCQEIGLPNGDGAVPKNVIDTKVLVTGGAGFIGSNLVDRLLELGYTVRILDNLYTGFLRNVPLHKEGVEFVLGDILDPAVLAQAVEDVDYVFHLAAMSKVVPSVKDPDMARFCLESNALGTWNVLNATRSVNGGDGKGIKKVVYAASSTYYGNMPSPQREDVAPDFLTPYAASKYEGELQMQMFDRLFQVPTISTRFFMVYGPRQPSTGAYAIVTGVFAQQAADGKPLTIEGDGSHYRDFIHVQDIVSGLILSQQHPSLRGDVVNLGTGTAFSVQDVADLVSSNQVHIDPRKNDLEGTLADTCRMKKLLGYRASKDFKKEMTYMVKNTLAGNVFMQSWLAPAHALAAPHLLAPGTPVFNWPKNHADLDALLLAIENVEVDGKNKNERRISVIPFSLDEKDDSEVVRNVLLNTVFSLVRFGGVFNYLVAASSKAAAEACISLNVPCYDAQNTTFPELLSNLLARGYDVHFAQADNSYMRPVAAFADELVNKNGDADVYQATPAGDFFVRNNDHAKHGIATWVKDSTNSGIHIPDLFTASKWPQTLRSVLKISSFDVSTICKGSLTGSGSTPEEARSPLSWSSDAGEASSYCDNSRFYMGVGCSDRPSSAVDIKAELEKANLWHLRECVDKKHCDIQQSVPSRWVQKKPDLKATEAMC